MAPRPLASSRPSAAVRLAPLSILGLGTALPAYHWPQKVAAEFAQHIFSGSSETSRLLPVLYRRAGVRQRHSVLLNDGTGELPTQSFFDLPSPAAPHGPTTGERMRAYAEHAPALAMAAAREALTQSNVSGAAITHLITVSCTGFAAPCIEVELIDQLGLPRSVQRTQIGFMGCHGALNGLRVAHAFAAADPGACILVVAVELCSLHFHYGDDPEQMVANALFADGAAAVVVRALERDVAQSTSNVLSHVPDWNLLASGSCIIHDSTDAMTWRIGDHGFEMSLSSSVPDLIETHLRPWLIDWLAQHNCTLESIQSWAVHPGGPRILGSVEKALALPAQALAVSREVLARHGNMSSPTLLFILNELIQNQAATPCVALGFGPGLAVEAALFL